MAKVIAVANQKGGCSKTSVVANLGIGLAMEGKKVAMIDADPQGSLTASLGYQEPDDIRYTLATIMMNIINEEEIDPLEGIEYVLFCLERNTTKVNNIKKYLLAALFNAPSTIDSYYRAEVNHDMYGAPAGK